MLNNVPKAMARAGRQVTLRHPNAKDCTVWRKKLLRTGAPGDDLGGIPNIGGLGVLDAEDEADFEFEVVGDAKIVFAGIAQPEGANWNDVDSGIIPGQMPQEALIEFIDEANGHVKKPDIISVEPGGGIVLIYEVIGENSTVDIPPYVRRFIVAQRSDQQFGIG